MNEKMDVKEVVKIGLTLFAITAISAALLAFVNGKTAPLIAENAIKQEQQAMKTVMSEAVDFVETKLTPEILSIGEEKAGAINKIYEAKGADGKTIGICVITETTGYDKGIKTVTGVDKELSVTGIDIISMNETPGLGANADNDDFKAQYKGKSEVVGVSKTGADDKNIQAISGATKTSAGVTNGVNIALKAAEALIEGGNK